MSFIGAVSASVRQVLARYAANIEHPCLIVGAGNFTMPSVLRSGGYTGPITACDVSLYTSALGAFLSGTSLDIAERSDCPPHLRGLLRTGSALEVAASVSLLLDLREVWKANNAFQLRLLHQHREKWEQLMETTMPRLEKYHAHIGAIDYQPRDGFDLLEASAPAHTIFAFPPTYKNGYEKLEELLRAVACWSPPPYREMTDKSTELYEKIATFDAYYVVLEKNLPEVFDILGQPSSVLPRGRGRTTYIVARHARKVVIRQSAKTASVGPLWPSDRAVTGAEMPGFAVLSRAQSLHLNELFLARRIDYYDGGVDACLALTLDGCVIGKADFMKQAKGQWKLPTPDTPIYLMCDLALPSTAVPRLAKLVLLLLTSREVKTWLDARLNSNLGWVITTAFCAGPVSMKYRGVFEIYSRKENKAGGGYVLNYFAPLGRLSLAESFALWRKKHNKLPK